MKDIDNLVIPTFTLKNDPTDSVSDKITRTLIEMKNKGYITEENLDHLKPAKCTTGQFYLLPKIHKKNIPGRPICSSVAHPTSRMSKFVDAHIKKYVPTTKSYIRDTQDFITKIKQLGPIPEGAILVTLDVSSLYKYSQPRRNNSCSRSTKKRPNQERY